MAYRQFDEYHEKPNRSMLTALIVTILFVAFFCLTVLVYAVYQSQFNEFVSQEMEGKPKSYNCTLSKIYVSEWANSTVFAYYRSSVTTTCLARAEVSDPMEEVSRVHRNELTKYDSLDSIQSKISPELRNSAQINCYIPPISQGCSQVRARVSCVTNALVVYCRIKQNSTSIPEWLTDQ